MPTTKPRRTTSAGTKALELAENLRDAQSDTARQIYYVELVTLLKRSDFRVWRLDPTQRPKRKPVAKKAAKRGARK